MGGSSVPSSTTQTTMLDPTRQAALKNAMGYFDKWASNYKGPTYKGPLTAGRTSDWYAAQNMAHKMANRFSEGGITSVRRFDDGGSTVSLTSVDTPAPTNNSFSFTPTTSDPNQVNLTMEDTSAYTPAPTNNSFSFTPATSDPNQVTLTVGDTPAYTPAPTNNSFSFTPAIISPEEMSRIQGVADYAANHGLSSIGADQFNNIQSMLYPNQVNLTMEDTSSSPTFTNDQYISAETRNGEVYKNLLANNPALAAQAAWSAQQENNPTSPYYRAPDTGGLGSLVNTGGTGGTNVNTGGTGGTNVNTGGTGGTNVNTGNASGKTDAQIAAEKAAAEQAAKDAALQKAITDANLTPANVTPTVTSTNMGSPYLLGQALTLGGAGSAFRLGSDVTPKQIYNSYNTPVKFTPDTWDTAAMDTYMSPYTQGVVDIALREAARQRGIERLKENTAATQSGAFGGYRQGVVEAEGERNYNQLLSDIETKGYQNAYTDAVSQFAADRAAKQAAYNANQQALQAAATGDINAGQLNQANKFQAFTNQLNALNQGVNNVQNLSALETAYQTGNQGAQGALNSADASAAARIQAQYDAIQKQLADIINAPLFVAQNASGVAGLSQNPSSTQVRVTGSGV
jgi:hypothetical protein